MTVAPHVALEGTYVATALAKSSLVDAHRIDPSILTHEPYRSALAAMMRMRLDDERITPMSLTIALDRWGVKGANELVGHLREIPVDPDLEPIAKRLRELSRARDYRSGSLALREAAERQDLDVCREVVGRMMISHDVSTVEQPVITVAEMIDAGREAVIREGTEQRVFISLGMKAIDNSFKLSPGSTLILGAQTNVGKSSALLTWLLNITRSGIPAGLVSVEDPTEDYGAKLLGAVTGINPARMWMGRLTSAEKALIDERARTTSSIPLSFSFVKSRDIDDVLARVEFMVRVRGARVIAVDYLQAIRHRPGKDMRERIDNTLEELIALCGRLNVALILLSQMSRPEKGNPFKEPHINDLKESGNIEIRAQCIVLLWRESDAPGTPVKAKVAKAKRVAGGVRFELSRDPDNGMLVESSTLAPRDPQARQGRFAADEEDPWAP